MGPRGEWFMHGQSMALLANCNRDRKKYPAPFKSTDFMPPGGRPEKKPQTVEQMKSIFASLRKETSE